MLSVFWVRVARISTAHLLQRANPIHEISSKRTVFFTTVIHDSHLPLACLQKTNHSRVQLNINGCNKDFAQQEQ